MTETERPMKPTPKSPKSEARIGGMVAAAVLVFLALFTVAFVVMAG